MTDTRLDAYAAVLPPPSPALRAHMAADRLRRAAQAALEEMQRRPDYWAGGWKSSMENGLGGPSGDLAGLLSPEVAQEIADLLDTAGQKAVQRAAEGGRPDLPEHFTAIVDRVLADDGGR
jgi:hypothetical protein